MTLLFAGFHFVALVLGGAGVWLRGRGLRDRDVPAVLQGDNLWGISALLFILTGVARAFGGLEKGSEFYLSQPFFWVKMGLFGAVWLVEIRPMVTFIRWRIGLGKGVQPDLSTVDSLRVHNTVEIVLLLLIPFAAAAMARGWNG
jgi:putative membrane protein